MSQTDINTKYYGQQCQDETINQDFRTLHHEVVNTIIQFCVKHNIVIDSFSLNADCLESSIKVGSWQPCTDSCLRFNKDTIANEKPFLISL